MRVEDLHSDWDMPENLSDAGQRSCEVIRNYIATYDLDFTGGCKVFYSPLEWKAREEDHGCDSELIICHDGGTLSEMNMSTCLSEITDILGPEECWVEGCECWYSAVYKL